MKRRGIRVRRVVRRVELWPVAKIGLLFHLVCFGLSLGVGVIVWQAAQRSGVLDDLAKFLGDVGVVDNAKKDIQFHGDAVFKGALYAGAILVVINTIATVLVAFFYNLLAGIFGGLVVSFLEEPARIGAAPVRAAETGRGPRGKRSRRKPSSARPRRGRVARSAQERETASDETDGWAATETDPARDVASVPRPDETTPSGPSMVSGSTDSAAVAGNGHAPSGDVQTARSTVPPWGKTPWDV